MYTQDYSEKAFVVRGDTKKHFVTLIKMKGRWNPNLRGGNGWIFSKKQEEKVEKWISIQNDELVEIAKKNNIFSQSIVDKKHDEDDLKSESESDSELDSESDNENKLLTSFRKRKTESIVTPVLKKQKINNPNINKDFDSDNKKVDFSMSLVNIRLNHLKIERIISSFIMCIIVMTFINILFCILYNEYRDEIIACCTQMKIYNIKLGYEMVKSIKMIYNFKYRDNICIALGKIY